MSLAPLSVTRVKASIIGGVLLLAACNEVPPSPVVGDTEIPDAALPLSWWQPAASDNLTWQWQLQGEIDTSFDVDVYNLDIEAPIEKIRELSARA
ncbi:MAG: hypothetical protein AAF404_02665 [Pseudomonadota bacterium]